MFPPAPGACVRRGLRRAMPWAGRPGLLEEAGDRVPIVDPADRVAEERGDRQDRELVRQIAGRRDGVGRDDPGDRRRVEVLHGVTGEHRVGEGRLDRGSAVLLQQEGGRLDQRASTCDLVVDDDAPLALDLADQVGGLRGLGVVVSTLVDDRHGQAQPARVAADHLGPTRIPGHEDGVLKARAPDVVEEDGTGLQLVCRDAEEALDLRRVQVHGEDAVRTGRLDQVGHEPCRDRDARLVLLVAAHVREVRDHRGDPSGGGVPQGIDRDQQLHDPLVDRGTRGLDHEDVRPANVLLDLDHEVLVREPDDLGTRSSVVEVAADGVGEPLVGLSSNDLQVAVGHGLSLLSKNVKGRLKCRPL